MSKDFELVVIDKDRGRCSTMPKFRVQSQKEESHYQCLSTTNREKPEKFMNATRKEETEPVPREPELYMNIAHAKRGMHPSQTLPRMGTTNTTAVTDEGAADVTPKPAVSSHYRAMEILKTYIKAEPVTKEHGNAASSNSDTESDSSDFTPAPTPQRSGRINTYISKHPSTQMKSSGPSLKSDVCTQPAMHSVVALGQSRSHPDTAPSDVRKHPSTQMKSSGPSLKSDVSSQPAMHSVVAVGQSRSHPDTAPDLQTLSTSSKKDEGKSSNKCLLFSIVVCCVLVTFLVFTLLLTFVWLNRSELEKNQAEYFISTATSNMLIMNLTKQVRNLVESDTAIRNLNASLIQMKMERDAAIGSLNESLSQMKMERDAAIGGLNAFLQMEVDTAIRNLNASLIQRDAAIGSLNSSLIQMKMERDAAIKGLNASLQMESDTAIRNLNASLKMERDAAIKGLNASLQMESDTAIRNLNASLKMERDAAIKGLNASLQMESDTAIRNLNASLIQMKMERDVTIRNLNASLSQMKMERDATIGNLTNLQLMIDSHASASENNYSTLASNYTQVTNRIDTLQDEISLQSRCNISSVNCDVSGRDSEYQLSCTTLSISRTTSVSHIFQ